MSELALQLPPAEEALIPFVAAELPVDRVAAHGDAARFAACAFVACIPACNEEERIGRCLAALDDELESGDGVLLAANGCADETVERALAAVAGWSRPWLVLDARWQGKGNAPLARRLALDVGTGISPDAVLFSLDADTIVLPGLRAAYAAEFARGFDLVYGGIGLIGTEAAQLPAPQPGNEEALAEYRESSRHLASLIRPDPDNPWPYHGNAGGANFAVRGTAYRRAGGLPTPPFGEDRALRRRFEAEGLRIRYADGPRVETSPRLDGRAFGGLADELRRNRFENDPIVDELLEPPETLLLRYRSRSRFLDEPDGSARAALLRSLGLNGGDAVRFAARGGEAGWQEAEALSPRLRRRRMRMSDVHRWLPELRQALARMRDARSGNPAFP